jgi:hypothetical protein
MVRWYEHGVTVMPWLRWALVRNSFSSFLYITFYKFLGVVLEDLVDLVEEIVELALELLAVLTG